MEELEDFLEVDNIIRSTLLDKTNKNDVYFVKHIGETYTLHRQAFP